MKSSALGGIVLALAGIAVGLYLDGGKLGQLLQPTAALIVFGGTLGAVLVQFPLPIVAQAIAQLKPIFLDRPDEAIQLINTLSRYASQARRKGALSLDPELQNISDPFLQRCMTLVVDGTHSQTLRTLANTATQTELARDLTLARVFDAAGGFAPTIGILGAIIGLIQVMQHMENISEVGRGIAVAFVATIYGVGAANLFFLPCAGRIRVLSARRHALREMIVAGVVGIAEGLSAGAIEQRLSAHVHSDKAMTDRRASRVVR